MHKELQERDYTLIPIETELFMDLFFENETVKKRMEEILNSVIREKKIFEKATKKFEKLLKEWMNESGLQVSRDASFFVNESILYDAIYMAIFAESVNNALKMETTLEESCLSCLTAEKIISESDEYVN